jgi:hypothetical protein
MNSKATAAFVVGGGVGERRRRGVGVKIVTQV